MVNYYATTKFLRDLDIAPYQISIKNKPFYDSQIF